MRHNQNRRSRSRNRKGPNPLTRSFESNGPDVKVRGTAPHVAEKYMSLARDAQSSGDIVAAENYLQHAEHYNRIVMAAQAQLQQERQAQFGGADDGYDDDREMNGRGGIRDRFESNTSSDEEEGDDRFDSSEEEQERSFQPPRQQQPRMNDRNGPRGPRPDRQERYDRGPRPDGRNDGRPERSEARSDYRGEGRGDRNERPRFERNEERGGERADLRGGERVNDRPARFDRDERQERGGRGERDERREINGVEREPPEAPLGASPVVADLPAEMSEEPVRRRRGRPPRSEAAAPGAEPDATPDGAAALAAFPE